MNKKELSRNIITGIIGLLFTIGYLGICLNAPGIIIPTIGFLTVWPMTLELLVQLNKKLSGNYSKSKIFNIYKHTTMKVNGKTYKDIDYIAQSRSILESLDFNIHNKTKKKKLEGLIKELDLVFKSITDHSKINNQQLYGTYTNESIYKKIIRSKNIKVIDTEQKDTSMQKTEHNYLGLQSKNQKLYKIIFMVDYSKDEKEIKTISARKGEGAASNYRFTGRTIQSINIGESQLKHNR